MNSFEVYLSPLAELKLDFILQYIRQEWGSKSKQNFLSELSEKVNQLSAFPQSCPESQIKPEVR